MPEEIKLKKVSDSRIKQSDTCIAVYECEQFTLEIAYNIENGYITLHTVSVTKQP